MNTSLALLALIPMTMVAMKAQAAPVVGKPAPDFTASAVDGDSVTLSDYKGKIVVLEWNNPGCPFVHKHYDSGNMQKLQSYAHDKGAVWLTINSSADGKQGAYPADKLAQIMSERHSEPTAYLRDADGKVAREYEAKTTPHMFVIDPQG